MNTKLLNQKILELGLLFSLLSILFGFLLGAYFGLNEKALKDKLKLSSDIVFDSIYQSSEDKRQEVLSKSWSYLKRAHLHSASIGATALAGIAVIMIICSNSIGFIGAASSFLWGLGGLLYGLFWLLAGLLAPSLGSTSLSKEYYSLIAQSGAAFSILGVLGLVLLILRRIIFLR